FCPGQPDRIAVGVADVLGQLQTEVERGAALQGGLVLALVGVAQRRQAVELVQDHRVPDLALVGQLVDVEGNTALLEQLVQDGQVEGAVVGDDLGAPVRQQEVGHDLGRQEDPLLAFRGGAQDVVGGVLAEDPGRLDGQGEGGGEDQALRGLPGEKVHGEVAYLDQHEQNPLVVVVNGVNISGVVVNRTSDDIHHVKTVMVQEVM